METKEIAVTCPCCDSRITVDVRTQKILVWRKPGEVDVKGKPVMREEDWDAAQSTVTEREERSKDAFDAGLSREKERARNLDDLWKNIQKDED